MFIEVNVNPHFSAKRSMYNKAAKKHSRSQGAYCNNLQDIKMSAMREISVK